MKGLVRNGIIRSHSKFNYDDFVRILTDNKPEIIPEI